MDGAASVASTRPQPVVIRPPKRWVGFGLRELWRFRELLVFLAWRDLKVRYKQTILGVAWAVLQPLLYTFVATLLFKRLLDVYSVGPYELLALAGFVFWLPFANAVTLASNSLVGNASLVTKVYFPRLLAPLGNDRRERRRPRALDRTRSWSSWPRYGDVPRPAARAGSRSPPCSSPRPPRSASARGSPR